MEEKDADNIRKVLCKSFIHPPDPVYDPVDVLEYMSETCHQTLTDDPNTKIITAGYINHLNIKELMRR